MEKELIKGVFTAGILIYTSANAEVILDQIGPMDGSALGLELSSNQYFESEFSDFNVGVIDNFLLFEETELASIEMVIDGWSGFNSPATITSYEVNIYSSGDEAAISLTGDIAVQEVSSGDVTQSLDWYGPGFLISVPVQIALPAGSYWCSVIPSNAFDPDGQIGLYGSTLGDFTMSMQANPGEGLGFGPIRKLSFNSAFRIHNNVMVDPCSIPLPFCSEDVNGDGFVSILDLLDIIAQWGTCGDGAFRPSADCAPLPNGDCCVNIADVLAVVAAWGTECIPHGACCMPEGTCESPVTEQFCLVNSGVYFGDLSLCEEQECFFGACCLDAITCIPASQYDCEDLVGLFKGDGSDCIQEDCSQLPLGDECSDAITVLEGETTFDTSGMTPSHPQPDDSLCPDSNLIWGDGQDVWFEFTATASDYFNFTLCDIDSYDTSMVLYKGNCSSQVACNGDSVLDEECQSFYSEITFELEENETYYVRIGGWHGDYGTGTLAISLLPPAEPGACCFTNGVCFELIEIECDGFDGTFIGVNTECESADCIILVGDECDEAAEVTVGTQSFSTEYATPSLPVPFDSMCSGTYLEWGEMNPDIWMVWDAPDSGFAAFSTCDETGFDTSMVLYENTCDNQVACNGDGEPSGSCQNYYSLISYQVTAGTSYYIRIGGWQGTVGAGSLTIELDGDNAVAACCYQGACFDALSEVACMDMNGNWQEGENCSTFNCEDILCHSSVFTQTPHTPSANWFASNSSIDSTQSVEYNRTEFVNVGSSSKITVWGLQAHFDGAQWSGCDSDYLFTVRSYTNEKGFPGPVNRESLHTVSTRTATGTLYAGVYELIQWEMDFVDVNLEHIGVQSESDGLDCWFLWLSSGEGDSKSSVNTGSGWSHEGYDLSICIDD